jgi:hypothetical protein
MPRSATTICTLLLGGAFAVIAHAQHPTTGVTMPDVPCSSCHTCEKPTSENPCLRACTRATPAGISEELSRKHGPDVVILNELEDLYLPVPFDHKGHAAMAEMTRGCAVCHHYSPEGVAQPACKSCHEVSPLREDMRKPSLKAAYHRQCLSCHREWSHETACEICHPPKAGRITDGGIASTPTKDDIMGQMHPPIPEPETTVYQTKYKYMPGTKVTFRHKEHIHRFGFRCAECHNEDSCSRCHEEGKSEAQRVKTLEEHHNPCANCHDMDNPDTCDRCHWEEGKPEPAPFDHASTGWPLGRYHGDQNCRLCHESLRFTKLDRDCNACHDAWAPDNFDHNITGQALDENHAEHDCQVCHIDRKFDRPPTCDECHEEDEGIAFPAKRPGPVIDANEHRGDPKPAHNGRSDASGPHAEQHNMNGFARVNEDRDSE